METTDSTAGSPHGDHPATGHSDHQPPAGRPRRRRTALITGMGAIAAVAVIATGAAFGSAHSTVVAGTAVAAQVNTDPAAASLPWTPPGWPGSSAGGDSGGQSDTGQSGTGQSGTGQSGTGQSGTGQSGSDPYGSGQLGSGQSGIDPYGNGQFGGGQSGIDPYGNGQFGSGQAGSGSDGTGTSSSVQGGATAAQQVGVVDINTVLEYQGAEAAGTGMVLTADGEILTNNHVVAGATSITVTVVASGQSFPATVVGTDVADDIAVLKLSGASDLSTAKFSTSTGVAVGDAVTGVGNAAGAGGTPSAAEGKVTALNQTITTESEGSAAGETLHGLIETNADIQAGDSGGPLFDKNDQIVGIDTAAQVGGYGTAGYAIPIASALTIAQQIEHGQASANIVIGYPAFLGVQVSSTTSNPNSQSTASGAVISGVVSGTPAAKAGIVAGDTITAVDGTSISTPSDLTSALGGDKPGQNVTITWVDGTGASQSATVTLTTGPAL